MDKNLIRSIIFATIAIIIAIVVINFIFWIFPIILIAIVAYLIYTAFKTRTKSPKKEDKVLKGDKTKKF